MLAHLTHCVGLRHVRGVLLLDRTPAILSQETSFEDCSVVRLGRGLRLQYHLLHKEIIYHKYQKQRNCTSFPFLALAKAKEASCTGLPLCMLWTSHSKVTW